MSDYGHFRSTHVVKPFKYFQVILYELCSMKERCYEQEIEHKTERYVTMGINLKGKMLILNTVRITLGFGRDIFCLLNTQTKL